MPRPGEEVSGAPLPPPPFRSIPEMIAAHAAAEPGRAAVRYRAPSGKWADLSWRALDERRRTLAAALVSLGVKPGEVVALVAPNSVEMLIAELANISAGAAAAPLFAEYTADVLLHCLADCGA